MLRELEYLRFLSFYVLTTGQDHLKVMCHQLLNLRKDIMGDDMFVHQNLATRIMAPNLFQHKHHNHSPKIILALADIASSHSALTTNLV